MNYCKILLILFLSLTFTSCKNGKELDPNRPLTGEEKRRKNIEEGGGALGNLLKRGGTNYEFSTSNPMWRASLETLDFLPLTTVDYSGGIIITDWYSEDGKDESIKLTIRFLSNEIRSDSLKIIIHKKVCQNKTNCQTIISDNDVIKNELRSTILREAALLEKSDKEKK